MKWSTPQCVSAIGSLVLGFLICYIAFFISGDGDIAEGPLWVLGQAFLYAGAIFGVKGYIDGKYIKFKSDVKDSVEKILHDGETKQEKKK